MLRPFAGPGRARRILLSAGLGLLALVPTPAGAAEREPGLQWNRRDAREAEDSRLSGTVRLRADVVTEDPVEGWSITVLSTEEEPVFGTLCGRSFDHPRDRFSVNCRWDTTRYPDREHSANARYLIRLMTSVGDTSTPAGPDRQVAVTNPASAPRDVELSYDEGSGRAVLTWAPNPEPDIAHYDVEEKVSKGSWKRIAETTEARFETTVADRRDHRFRVAAERRDAEGIAGGPGPWTPAAVHRTSSSPDGQDRRSGTTPSRPADQDRPRSASPAAGHPEPPPGTAGGTGRPSPAGERRPRGGSAAPGATARPADPPPAGRAALAFSSSSAEALNALADPPDRGSAPGGMKPPGEAHKPRAGAGSPRPAVAMPEPDTGFQPVLPYKTQEEALGAPPEPTPGPASPAPIVHTGRSSPAQRAAGIGLFLAGAVLLAATLRPRRRSRRRSAHAVAPSVAGDEVRTVEEPPWLARLEACVDRLEACLTEQPA